MSQPVPEQTIQYKGAFTDSTRWTDFKNRPDDIFVCTPPKSGTTWMQAICALLVFQTPDLKVNPAAISPWIDAAFSPIEDVLALLEKQTHRRIIKTHTPLDGIPFFPECQYICVYRDPRDVYLSFRSHIENMKLDIPKAMLEKSPEVGFREWVATDFAPGEEAGPSLGSILHHLKSFQAFESLPNIGLYHYSDLTKDLTSEMQAIADQLGIQVDSELLPRLAESASFRNMKSNAKDFAPGVDADFWHDSGRFFNKGTSGQWRDVISAIGNKEFAAALARGLSPDRAQWLMAGWSAS